MLKKIVFLITLLGLFSAVSVHAAVSDWQKGATIDPTSPTSFASEELRQSLANLVGTGANFVAFVIPYYQSSVSSADLAPGWNTPTDEALIAGIRQAHSLGLKVMLKMHPEVQDGSWRGAINPTDRAAWFDLYGSLLEHYAQLAQEQGVEQICLGAELAQTTSPRVSPDNTRFWNQLIDRVRSYYSGALTYSAQHTYPWEADEIQFWDRLDYIGYAAYWALDADNPQPTLESLKNAWEKINHDAVSPLAQKWGKPVLFTEIGYRSMVNAHSYPWEWGKNDSVDEAEQARDYEALFSYWNDQPSLAGIFLWRWEINPAAGGPNDNGYTPQNKQAQAVMTAWFGGNEAKTTPTPTPTNNPEPTPTPQPTSEPEPTTIPTPTPTAEPTESPSSPTLTPTPIPTGNSPEPTATPTPNLTPSPTPSFVPPKITIRLHCQIRLFKENGRLKHSRQCFRIYQKISE